MPLRLAPLPVLPLLLALAGSALWAGESPEAVLDRVAAAPAGQGVEMEFVLVQYRNGRRVEARGVARYHADGKRFINDVKTQAGDRMVDVHMICDGSVVWVEVREGTKKLAVQKLAGASLRALGGASPQDPKAQVEDLRKRYALTESRDGKLGETPVTILEGALKPEFIERQVQAAGELGGPIAADLARPQLQSMARARVWVELESGRIRKTEVLDKGGQILISFAVERVRTGVVLDEALFAYTPPEDVEVVDLDRTVR